MSEIALLDAVRAIPVAVTSPSGHWVDDLSPFAIHFGGEVGIRWYGLAYLAGLLWGYWLTRRWSLAKKVPLTIPEIQDLILYAGLGMIIGGRLGYCLLYAFDEILHDPLFVIRIWQGGMASHGGMLGLTAGAWWFARKKQRSLPVLVDLIAVTGTMGVGLGRIANFINGELWGRPSDVPWAVIFPNSVTPPSFLAAGEARAWQIAHAVPRHPSQLYAAFMEGFIILAILLPIHVRHRRPGLTTGVFCCLYGVARFIDEFFREPDRGYVPFFGWMSKGQLYTLPLFVLGFALIAWALRRPPRPNLYLVPEATAIPDRPH